MQSKDWKMAETLEDAFRKAIQQGKDAEFFPLISLMAPKKKEKYREIWKEEMSKKKNKKGAS